MGNTHKQAIDSSAADKHVNNGSVWIGKRAYTHTHTQYLLVRNRLKTLLLSSGDFMVCNPELHFKCALKGPNTQSFEN